MASARSLHWAVVLVLAVPALFTSNFIIARSAPGVIAPNTLAAERWLFAGLLFCFMARAELRQNWRQVLADWPRTFVLAALGMWICGAWVYVAGQTSVATNMALIYSLSPVLIVVFSHYWLREPFGWVQAVGVALALAGVVHVVLKGQWQDLARVRFVPGDFWILGATLSWTVFSLLLKRWKSPLSDNGRLGVMSLAGVLVLLPFAGWEALSGPLPPVSAGGLVLALSAALLPGYGAYLGYSVLVRRLGAARGGVILYLLPLYAAVLAWLLLGEPIHSYHVVGFVLVLPGIYLANRR